MIALPSQLNIMLNSLLSVSHQYKSLGVSPGQIAMATGHSCAIGLGESQFYRGIKIYGTCNEVCVCVCMRVCAYAHLSVHLCGMNLLLQCWTLESQYESNYCT